MAHQYHFDPDTYLQQMLAAVPEYVELQDRVVALAGARPISQALDLGIGSGETARRLLVHHPQAHVVGIDASEAMLAAARASLPAERVTLRVQRLEDPLPAGPFDIVISALAVHHLDGFAKLELFQRVAAVLVPGGRFVLGDVVIHTPP